MDSDVRKAFSIMRDNRHPSDGKLPKKLGKLASEMLAGLRAGNKKKVVRAAADIYNWQSEHRARY